MHCDISVRVAKVLFWNSLVRKNNDNNVNETVSSKIMYIYSTSEGVICSQSCMSCFPSIFPKDVFAHLRVVHHCTVHGK